MLSLGLLAAGEHFPGLTPYMHAQESAVAFYERCGWRKFGAAFVEAGIVHYAMVKTPPSGETPKSRTARP
jgi:predicted GNAT family N-acyltransferase